MRKGRKLIVSLLTAVLLCFSALAAGAAEEAGTEISVKSSEISQTLARINTLYQYLKVNSFYDIEEDDIEENLTRALMASLNDPYAAYFTNDEAQDMEESIAGSYVGLGVYISKYDPLFIEWEDETTWMLQITSPFPGGPADRAGLRAKDYISHINGESVAQMTVDEASELLKGEEGVPVTLTVHRGSSVFTISVAPEKVTTPTISYTMLEGTDYGYIAITTFSTTTYPLVSEALTNLTAQGLKALIIDLRNNGGGTVNSASLIANYFVQTGDVIFTIEYKDGSGRTDTFNYTVYIQADYMVWNLGQVKTAKPRYIVRKGDRYRDLRGIVLWGAVQYNPNDDVAYMPFFANGGVLFNAPFKSRADDVLCFGIAYGKYSGKLRDYEKNSYEMVLELNYKIQVNRFMFVQPNIQGIINPKGGKYSDAMVLGIQFGFNL